ncbi:hypothetical protein FQR65_LT01468 [Abscondita terminalis]|nr:hypothetical protein FQR65_LT01468 [Abscondita terminalis]
MGANKGSKSKLGKAELNTLLHNLEREHKEEMRMHDTIKKRFQTKHSKLDLLSNRGSGSANVKLFQTHTPGFCFRRNGEAKQVQNATTSSAVTYEDIYSMLFTDGELDIEKVLGLHLLTAHKTETLTPPVKCNRPFKFLIKEKSPLERLIERSKKRRKIDDLTKLLPTYVIDLTDDDDESHKSGPLIRDGRLAQRIIINDKIVQLVHTVLDALRTSNPHRMDELIAKANDQNYLTVLVDKSSLQVFWANLQNQMIVYNCDFFHLTPPFKANTVSLRLTTSRTLRKLIHHIRENVFQYPSHGAWRNEYDRSQYKVFVEKESDKLLIDEDRSKKDSDEFSKENVVVIHSLNCLSDEVVGKKTRLSSSKNSKKCEGSTSHRSDNESLINNTMAAVGRDSKIINIARSDVSQEKISMNEEPEESGKKPPKKASALTLDDVNDNNIKNISVTQLSKIINYHIKKLTSDDKRIPKLEKKKKTSSVIKNFAKIGHSVDSVALGTLDLAKITQEIRVKETQKKLAKFLQNNQVK